MNSRDAMLLAIEMAGINRRELARRIKTSAPFVTKILYEDHNITVNTLRTVVEACGFELLINIVPKRKK